MSDIYLDVTNKIVSALSQGVIPWIKPWTTSGSSADAPFPINAITRRPYAGINIPLLWAEARLRGYRQDRWLTYNQARKAGGHVRKGEQSTLAVLYNPMSKEAHDKDGQVVRDEQGNVKMVQFALLRTHCLFNIEQTEGLPNEEQQHAEGEEPLAFIDHAPAERLLAASGARIEHRYGDDAFYLPIRDLIQLPTKAQFVDVGSYYATALHELTHWSGHHARLNREGITGGHGFGSPAYAFEELVAEMGAAFLCALTGTQGELRHEEYLASWLKILKEDKRAIFRASGLAREASEFLLALLPDQATEATERLTA
ncbi:zincin-like metallopeptidase domain-containing protein [Pseudomonas sp. GD03858]|uniref:ArdC family protein n=1 Tax=unclassified Pseudomonas TaxID=196821 RepID=UPI002447DED5|nr:MULTISPECIES: zincin-like metallopeptidase domain-containing protein [unclassified Pseudomonas]MDH0645249.1 zincin-like metallopeptidase domain-containing protein [Pseudomonas sp. GD03867]MDH0660871.1 zincin-like metallopeptidase domain-containing protein [Pseudomonas sp. GD03858]